MTKWFLDSNKTCTKCPTECATCSSASVCLTCVPDYKLQNSSCMKCTGYSVQCSECTNELCSNCVTGYTLLSNNTCSICPSNCASGCTKNS